MELWAAGDWMQVDHMVRGLRLAQEMMLGTNDNSYFGELVIIFAFGGFIFYIVQAVKRRVHVAAPFLYLAMMGLWMGLAFSNSVDVTIAGAAASPQLTTKQSQLQTRVNDLTAKVMATGKKAFVIDPRAEAALNKAKQQLHFINKMVEAERRPVVKTSPLIAAAYTFSKAVYLNVQRAIDAVTDQNLTDRAYQAQLVRTMNQSPFLSPSETQAAARLSNCLLAKQMYLQHIQQTASRVQRLNALRKDPAKNAAEIKVATDQIMFERTQLEEQCTSITAQVSASVDKAITSEEIRDFESAYFVPEWLPWVGGTALPGLGQKNVDEKANFLVAQVGLSLQEIKAMSSEQLARTFLRYKHLKSMAKAWQDDALNNQLANQAAPESKGFKASAGEAGLSFMAGFALAMKPIMTIILDIGWMLVLWSGAVVGLIALLPGWHTKAPIGFAMALTFLGLWSVANTFFSEYAAHLATQKVGAQAKPEGPIKYVGALASGTWDQFVGKHETDLAVGLAAGANAGVAFRPVLSKAITSLVAVGADLGGPVVWGGAAVAAAGMAVVKNVGAASNKINKNDSEFQRLIAREAGGINPGLSTMYSGLLQAQQKSVDNAAAHADVIEALLLVFAPIFVSIIFFGGWKLLGGIGTGTGGLVAQASQGIGGMLGGRAMGGMGSVGRMGGKTPK